MSRRQMMLAALLGAMTLAACGELAHTNPLDPETPVAVEITGPDSAFTVFDTVSFFAHTSPSYSPDSVVWSSSAPGILAPIANGTFRIASSAPPTGTAIVRVVADGRVAEHALTFVHRATSVHIEECDTRSRTATIDALTKGTWVCLSGLDARGYPSPVTTATVNVSDTSIVAVGVSSGQAFVTARANGTAVARLSMAGLSDSMTITVRQRISDVWLAPAQCRSLSLPLTVGDSLQVSPTTVAFDPRQYLIADTARVRAAVRGMIFSLGDIREGGVTVSPSGMVTAVAPRLGSVMGYATTPEEGTVWGICFIAGRDQP